MIKAHRLMIVGCGRNGERLRATSDSTLTPATSGLFTNYVWTDGVNIRTGPSTSYTILGQAQIGQRLVSLLESLLESIELCEETPMLNRTALRAASLITVAAGAVALTVAPAFAASTVEYGQDNAAVGCVQEIVNYVDDAGLTVDDDFGDKTLAAVETFQKKYGLSVDGEVGYYTGGEMKSLANYFAELENKAGHSDNEYDKWETNCDGLLLGVVSTI